MLIISATGGSGSTFVSSRFKKAGWSVCLRPDVGSQKGFVLDYFKKRTAKFFKSSPDIYDDRELFELVYRHLKLDKKTRKNKTMLMLMVWGGLGFLKDLPDKKIYIVRSPIFTYNSYIKPQHLERLGAKSKDDPKAVDAFFGWYSHWVEHYKNALEDKDGYVVRYENFKKDWEKIPDVPPIHKDFVCKNDISKLTLKQDTIDYIFKKVESCT